MNLSSQQYANTTARQATLAQHAQRPDPVVPTPDEDSPGDIPTKPPAEPPNPNPVHIPQSPPNPGDLPRSNPDVVGFGRSEAGSTSGL